MTHNMTTALERICSYLGTVKSATTADISKHAFACPCHVRRALNQMRECGLVHVSGYIRRIGVGGTPIILFSRGYGVDAKPPEHLPVVLTQRRRVRKLVDAYGKEISRRILNPKTRGGSSRIVIDGLTIYERGKERGKR